MIDSPDTRRDFMLLTLASSLGLAMPRTGQAAAPVGTPGQVFTGSAAADAWVPFKFMQDGAEHVYGEMVLFRSQGSAGNGLAVGLWRAPDGATPIYTSEVV